MAERKEPQKIFSTSNGGSTNTGSVEVRLSDASCSWLQATDLTQTTDRPPASAPGVVNGVAAALQHGAAGLAPETVAAPGQTFAAAVAAENITAVAAALPRETQESTGVHATAQDSGKDVCAIGQHCSEVLSGQVDGGSGWNVAGLHEHQPVTLATAAAGKALGDNRTWLTAPAGSSVTLRNTRSATAAALPQSSVSSLGEAIANLSESNSPSTEASTTSMAKTYSVCEQCVRSGGRRLVVAVEGFAVDAGEDFSEERSTSVAEAQVIGAESASDGSTSSSASDCCGCVGPTAETSIPDAAGVPPYLRIETLPALLEGSGGRACVWLGQKKEALLYSVATPFGVNKCVLVCIYMLYAFLTGCVYFGWPSMSYMLLTSGAYSWRCPKDSNGEFVNDLRKPQNSSDSSGSDSTSSSAGPKTGKYYICDEQDAAVGPLFTVAYVTQSLMSVVAGTLLDHVSPKHAAMLGQLLNAVGWVLLACSSYTFQAYIPAMVFIGLGADTAYLPTLLIAALFPGKRATVITLLGSANTASFAVPLLLEMLWRTRPDWNFSRICWLYLGVGPLFCCFLAALFIPLSSFGSAALQKLPLQQHQSPLHGSKEDALLRAEERDMKKRCVSHKGRHSGRCCCCCFRVSNQKQQDRTKRCQHLQKRTHLSRCGGVYAYCCCSDVKREARSTEKTATGRRRRPCGLLTNVLRSCSVLLLPVCKLLQRIRRVTLCCKPQTRLHLVQQQQEPRQPDLSRQPSQSINNLGFWEEDDVSGTECRGRADGGAAEGEFSTAAIPAGETGAGTVAGVSATAGIVGRGSVVGAKRDGSVLRSVSSGEICYLTYDGMGETRNGTAVHTADDAIEPHEKSRRCSPLCATGTCCGKQLAEEECFCACVRCEENQDRAACAALQERECSFVNSFLPHSSLTDEEALKTTRSPQHSTSFKLARSGAPAEELCGEEVDAQAFTAVYPVASAGPPELHSSPVAVEVEEEEEEEPSFCSQLLSSHFMCIVMYWSGMAVAISYFQSTSSRLFSTKALDFMDVALSFSFVPCVLLGKMIDLFGPFPALFLVNTMGVLAYCFALGGGSEQNVLQYVSILAFCVYVSVDSEQVFCYVENTFNSKHFGKLSGLALTTGGVISLVSIPLYDEITIRILRKNPLPVCCGLMVVLVLLYFTLGSTWIVRLKHPPAFKAKKKQMRTAAAAAPAAGMDGALAAAGRIALEAEEKKGEEAYALRDAETHIVAGLPNCLERRHSQCCCCCSGCASGNSSSNTRRMSIRSDNNSDTWTQDRIITTNVESHSTPQRPVSVIDWLLRPLGDLFHVCRSRTWAVEELHQQRGVEWQQQQQQRRGSRLGKGDAHLQAEVV